MEKTYLACNDRQAYRVCFHLTEDLMTNSRCCTYTQRRLQLVECWYFNQVSDCQSMRAVPGLETEMLVMCQADKSRLVPSSK